MAGLAVAATLEAHGASVTVLEAGDRVGGRNWTLRNGDGVPDLFNAPQTCNFSSGQYLNAGAWRVLPWHHRMRRLAKQHAVALEPLHTNLLPSASPFWQPAGGMDQLPQAMAKALRTPVQTCTQVLSIGRSSYAHAAGVSVVTQKGQVTRSHDADYVVVAVPLNVLGTLTLPLPAPIQKALHQVQAADAIKVGFESGPAPVEGQYYDRNGIRLLWPSGKSPLPQRICSVYGNANAIASVFSTPRSEQIVRARTLLQDAAPRSDLQLNASLVVQWSQVPFQQAAAARLGPQRASALRQLQSGVPPIFFAGDGLSSLNGWQEGALESAERVVVQLLAHHC